MLVLKMRTDHRTAIALPDGQIAFVTLTRIVGTDLAQVGFEFPPDCKVYRDEVWRQRLAQVDPRYAALAVRPESESPK